MGGHSQTAETRKKISETRRRNQYVTSESTRLKISQANKGRSHPHTAESKKKIGDGNRGKCSDEARARLRKYNENRGPCSKETRAKLSKVWKNRKQSEEHIRKRTEPRRGKKLKPLTDARKRQISIDQSGRTHSEEHVRKVVASNAKRMREAPNTKGTSDAERILGEELTLRNIPFITQLQVGRFSADFYIPSHNIILECDGCYWHACPECNLTRKPGEREKILAKDARKNETYRVHGYVTLRFWEHELLKSVSSCVDRISLLMNGKV